MASYSSSSSFSSSSAAGRRPHASPFHTRLSLSLDEQKELSRTTKRLVRDAMDGYERFLAVDHANLRPPHWAMVRERDDVRVYHDRRPGAGTDDRDLNVLLTVGTVGGSLPDALYGVLSHSTAAMRLKTAYVRDTLRDSAVLATVQAPTATKPFRSLTVKWLVKSVPLARPRDLVYMEATGTQRLSNGERIGFHLVHAVRFAQTPALPSYARTNLSSCSLWRQHPTASPHRCAVYTKTYVEIPSRLRAPLLIRATADSLLSVWRVMHCAQMKKIAWLVRRQASVQEATTKTKTAACRSESSSKGCAVCHHATAQASCVVCAYRVCNSCRVTRALVAVSETQELKTERVAICVPCLTLASRADATDVARDEIPDAPPQRSALVRVVGTRSSCPVDAELAYEDTEREREREWERERDRSRRSLSFGRKLSLRNPCSNVVHAFGVARDVGVV